MHFQDNYLDCLIDFLYYERQIGVVVGRKVMWLIFM
jgi:hypothetical protein